MKPFLMAKLYVSINAQFYIDIGGIAPRFDKTSDCRIAGRSLSSPSRIASLPLRPVLVQVVCVPRVNSLMMAIAEHIADTADRMNQGSVEPFVDLIPQ